MDELDEETQGRRVANETGQLSLDPTTGFSSLDPDQGGPGLSSLDDARAPSTTDLSTNTLGTRDGNLWVVVIVKSWVQQAS